MTKKLVENYTLEFKRELNSKLERSVIAFLNTDNGGRILIGMDDFGNPVGLQDDQDDLQLRIINRIRDNIEPSALGLFNVEVIDINDTEVIEISISGGQDKPYYLKSKGCVPGGVFLRVGPSVQQVDTLTIAKMKLYKHKDLKDIPNKNQNLAFRHLRACYSNYSEHILKSLLNTLDFYTDDGKYNLVANLFADQNNISIRVVKYDGIDKLSIIENNEYGYNSILISTEKVITKLTAENTVQCRIDYPKRIELPLIDVLALREATINAIVHNDYVTGQGPLFELYSDRLEITSYGGPVSSRNSDNFFSGGSTPRTREIMRIFRDMKYVENVGLGLSRILNKYGREIYTITDDYIKVTFKFRILQQNNYIASNNQTSFFS